MRSTLALHPARTLLLALALAACGGGGDADRPAAAAPEARTASVTTQDSAGAPCPTPAPAVDTTLFRGQWAVLTARLRELGANWPEVEGNTAIDTLPMCDSCSTVALTLRSEATAWCTTPEQLEQLDGQARNMGILILGSDFPEQHGWLPIAKGDTVLMFASGTDGPARMVYRNGEQSVVAPDTAWMFFYCNDGHVGSRPQAQWRPRAGSRPAQSTGRRLDESDGGDYGWMSCASGCCQFYTPPPNPIIVFPDQANARAREAVPSPGPESRPTWCPRQG
jgi:hypothetical protein